MSENDSIKSNVDPYVNWFKMKINIYFKWYIRAFPKVYIIIYDRSLVDFPLIHAHPKISGAITFLTDRTVC